MSRALIVVAYVLFGLLTLATFGGYFLIGHVLGGGEHPGWPPDRPVEWAAFAGVTGAVVGLMLGIGVIWLMSMAGLRQEPKAPAPEPEADRGES
jgi:biotin transporter BioY